MRYPEVSQVVNELILKLGSMEAVSRKLGVSWVSISSWRKGERRPMKVYWVMLKKLHAQVSQMNYTNTDIMRV